MFRPSSSSYLQAVAHNGFYIHLTSSTVYKLYMYIYIYCIQIVCVYIYLYKIYIHFIFSIDYKFHMYCTQIIYICINNIYLYTNYVYIYLYTFCIHWHCQLRTKSSGSQPEDGFMKKAETCRCYDFLIIF